METLHIKLDKPPRGSNFAHHVQGRAVAQNWHLLGAIAIEMKIKPLQAFLAIAGGTSQSLRGWFSASEAAGSIARLVSQISHQRRRFENTKKLLAELASYENILWSASARGSRFRFIADHQDTE